MNQIKRRNLTPIFIVITAVLAITELMLFSFICFYKDAEQAEKYYDQEDYSRAASLSLNLIERDSAYEINLSLFCANVYLSAGDYEGALSRLQSALENNPDDAVLLQKIDEINQTKHENPSTTLELTDDYKVYSDDHILRFFLLFAITIVACPVSLGIIKHKNRSKSKGATVFYIDRQSPTYYDIANQPKFEIAIADIQQTSFQYVEKINQQLDEFIHKVNIVNEDFDNWIDKHLLLQAIKIVLENDCCDPSYLERKLQISYGRAAALVEAMENLLIVTPRDGMNPRRINHDINSWSIAFEDRFSESMIKTPDDSSGNFENFKTDLFNLEMRKVDAMSNNGWEFEQYAADLLLKNGFVKTEVTAGSNDYGVDVIATDALGVRYAIQCKCYSNKLNNKSVQEVIAGKTMYNCQVGVVFTNNYFTDNAIELAKANNILLWDRDKLTQFVKNTIFTVQQE